MKRKIWYLLDYYLIVSISIFLTPVSEQSSLSVSCLNSCESNGAVKENVIDTTQIEPNTTKSWQSSSANFYFRFESACIHSVRTKKFTLMLDNFVKSNYCMIYSGKSCFHGIFVEKS